MKSLIALHALIALASAQGETFSFDPLPTELPTSVENLEPTAVPTSTGPISTASACAQISELSAESSLQYPVIAAELAFACLKSVPIKKDAAEKTIESLKDLVQMQSTITYLKDPPQGYANEGVDILGGLDDIKNKVNNGDYDNEFDFENDISALLVKAHDGHLGFDGMASGGVFLWRRSREIALISAADDDQAPKVWAVNDFNKTEDGWKKSHIVKINGKDATQFLEEEALQNAYHDPDTRYNAMFYQAPAENAGYFANPPFYPGPSMEVEFANKSTDTFLNTALVLDYESWESVSDPDDFYDVFITYRGSPTDFEKRDGRNLRKRQLRKRRLELPKEADIDGTAVVPVLYPEPYIQHQASDVPLAGYFVDTAEGEVGVLMIQTFNAETLDDIDEFQLTIQDFIEAAKDKKVEKIIIDVRTNGGGLVMLGYDTYLQFFPTQEPQLLARYRATQSTNVIGDKISSLPLTEDTVDAYTTPFNYHAYLSKDLTAFSSWEDMYGPEKFGNDEFTKLLRYNLSDPLVTSDERFSVGITMTGYGDRSSFREAGDPFKAENIIILTDGICASTCNLFTELMVQQSGVRTLAVGGRSKDGLMQAVGGTKGSLVLRLPQLERIAEYVAAAFSITQEEEDSLPIYDGVAYVDAAVNFQDTIRKGLEKDGIPTQFLNDSASCRIWYSSDNYLNVTSLWERTASVAFSKDGKFDESKCVKGSVASDDAQKGLGEGSPTSPEGGPNGNAPGASKSPGAAAAVFVPAKGGWAVFVVCATMVFSSMAFGASLI